MFRAFQIPVRWTELAALTYREVVADNVLGLAAQLSYYFLLSLVPVLVCVVAVASFVPAAALEQLVSRMSGVAPPEVVGIVRDQLASLSQQRNSGVLTFGLLFALWSSSAAMVSVIDALNRAYDIDESRPWWRVRLTAILLTLGVSIFMVVAFALVVVGPELFARAADAIGLGPAFTAVWNVLRWVAAFAIVVTGIGIVFNFAPDAEQEWEWLTPGAVAATILWLLASLAFRFYVTTFGAYNETYGSLAGVVVLMLWFYIGATAILVGAEMNAEIEHASPYGKDPGERAPGEKRKLGAAARRAWEAGHRARHAA